MSQSVLGLDIGFCNNKYCLSVDGEVQIGLGPVGVMLDTSSNGLTTPNIKDSVSVQVGDKQYLAEVPSFQAEHEKKRCLNDTYPFTDEYQALYYASLLKTGLEVIDTLVVGLPVDLFTGEMKAGMTVEDYREKLAKRLKGKHQITEKHAVKVKKVKIIPQPTGGYMHALAKGKLGEKKDSQKVVLVVDPGFFSFDWAGLVNGEVKKEYCNSDCELAVSKVLEKAASLMTRAEGFRVSKENLEYAIQNGEKHISVTKNDVEYQEYIDKVMGMDEMKSMLKNALTNDLRTTNAEIGTVVMVGGGAGYYSPLIEELYPHANVIEFSNEESVTVNAQGFCVYGLNCG